MFVDAYADPLQSTVCISYLISTLLAFVLVMVLTPFIKQTALKYNQVDLPSYRKVHRKPIPRVGGIAICIATITALSVVWFAGKLELSNIDPTFTALLSGGFCFFCIGLADDILDLSPLLRLAVQCIVAGALWGGGMRMDSLSLPLLNTLSLSWLSLPLTILWVVGIVNAINWIDGLDGLAAGVGSIAATVSFVLCLQSGQFIAARVCIALLGSLLGFLMFNFNPAQIFMGDGGSHFVGFLLAALCITGFDREPAHVNALLPVLVMGVPLIDMTFVILSRLYSGCSPFSADKRHLHHRLLASGLTHKSTVLFVYVLSVWCGSLAWLLAEAPGGSFVVIASTTALLVSMYKAATSLQQTRLFS